MLWARTAKDMASDTQLLSFHYHIPMSTLVQLLLLQDLGMAPLP